MAEEEKADDIEAVTELENGSKEFVFCSTSNTFLLLFIGLAIMGGAIAGIVAAVDSSLFGGGKVEVKPTVSPTASPTTFAVECRCISRICVPTDGVDPAARIQVRYPADGSLVLDGHNWCFVESSCPTSQVGTNSTCEGEKFGFTDGFQLPGSTDIRPIKAVPTTNVVDTVSCDCVDLTCTPTDGPNAGRTIGFPGDGSLTDGTDNFCFVEEDCHTTQLGNNRTCEGSKLAFLNGKIAPEGRDSYQVFGKVPVT